VFGVVLRVSSVWVAAQFPNAPISEAYAISGAFFYLFYILIILYCVKCHCREILQKALGGILVSLFWVGVAVLFVMMWNIIMPTQLGR
jgi:hypothetical protein